MQPNTKELNIKGITLMSVEEYHKYKENIPLLDKTWWLRSPGYVSFFVASVDYYGSVGRFGYYVDNSLNVVRPVLKVSNLEALNLKEKETFSLAGHDWTVISGDMAICNDHFGQHCYRNDWEEDGANNYEASDVKKFLENWAKENNILTQ